MNNNLRYPKRTEHPRLGRKATHAIELNRWLIRRGLKLTSRPKSYIFEYKKHRKTLVSPKQTFHNTTGSILIPLYFVVGALATLERSVVCTYCVLFPGDNQHHMTSHTGYNIGDNAKYRSVIVCECSVIIISEVRITQCI